mmetsp:Transcript_40397/g.125709  ORF Transcript_40397/g.125709 Transcript_40397/m.125709 type:complete len:240 (+) Transcript_40397:457-1176(+)
MAAPLCHRRRRLQRHQDRHFPSPHGLLQLRDVREVRPRRRPRVDHAGQQDLEAADGDGGVPHLVRPPLGRQQRVGSWLPHGLGDLAQEGPDPRAHTARGGEVWRLPAHPLPDGCGADGHRGQGQRLLAQLRPGRAAQGQEPAGVPHAGLRDLPLPGCLLREADHRVPRRGELRRPGRLRHERRHPLRPLGGQPCSHHRQRGLWGREHPHVLRVRRGEGLHGMPQEEPAQPAALLLVRAR